MKPHALALFCVLALTHVASCAQPNIVLIMTDDQDLELGSLNFMPKLQKNVLQAGATFERFYTSVPLCCPSRSSFFSGTFQHNNLVVNNSASGNCSSLAWQAGPELLNFGVSLQAAGYNTSLIGKYLNFYGDPSVGGVSHIPPGWDNWQALLVRPCRGSVLVCLCRCASSSSCVCHRVTLCTMSTT